MWKVAVPCVCSACARVCAALRVAALHCAVLRCAHHAFIHSFTYLLGLRAKEATRARKQRASGARVVALSQCVCTVVHVVLFSARGAKARLSPLAEAE